MIASIQQTPRALRPQRTGSGLRRATLVPKEKVVAMLHEIAYALHATRKVKTAMVDQEQRWE